jgi:hypothetical protein
MDIDKEYTGRTDIPDIPDTVSRVVCNFTDINISH